MGDTQDISSVCSAACATPAGEVCMAACETQSTPLTVSWQQVSAACGLLVLSGLFSGLTLGLMSLDIRELELVITGGDSRKRRQAERILPLRKRGNLLLCTLLLGNTLVNSGIAILTASFTGGIIGGAASTAFILIFGEIIPQSVCSRYGLAAGAKTVDVIRIIILVLFPVAWPLSKVLDRVLGEELGTIYSRHELRELFSMQAKRAQAAAAENGEIPGGQGGGGGDAGDGNAATGGVGIQEATYMSGILSLSERTAEMIMTKLDDVYALFTDERLDFPTMSRIYASGYTRVPVFRRVELVSSLAPGGSGVADDANLLLHATAMVAATRQARTQSDPQPEARGGVLQRSASESALHAMAGGAATPVTQAVAGVRTSPPSTSSTTRGGAGVAAAAGDDEVVGASLGYEGMAATPSAADAGGPASAAAAGDAVVALRRPPLVVPMAGMPMPALSLQPPSPTMPATPGDAPPSAGGDAPPKDATHSPRVSPGNSRHAGGDVSLHHGGEEGGGGRGKPWREHEVAGLLSAKDLILVDPEDALSVDQLVASCGREVRSSSRRSTGALYPPVALPRGRLAVTAPVAAVAASGPRKPMPSSPPNPTHSSSPRPSLLPLLLCR